MRKELKMMALLLCAAAMMTSCNSNNSPSSKENNSTQSEQKNTKSNDNKLAQFEKKATEYKATLGPDNKIIAERLDNVVQKVFFFDPNQDAEGVNPINNILMHDYATDKTLAILPDVDRINEYLETGELVDAEEYDSFNHCFNLDYRSSELIGDRLFMMIHTECSYEMETSLLFYVNVLDNSLHYITDCDDVKYDKAKGTIDVHKELMKLAGADLAHDFTLSVSSTDEEYAAMRTQNEKIENQMSDKWREENLD